MKTEHVFSNKEIPPDYIRWGIPEYAVLTNPSSLDGEVYWDEDEQMEFPFSEAIWTTRCNLLVPEFMTFKYCGVENDYTLAVLSMLTKLKVTQDLLPDFRCIFLSKPLINLSIYRDGDKEEYVYFAIAEAGFVKNVKKYSGVEL